jgi:hypothetical protein
MLGRADKGIIITTGTFTLEAKKEARRDGVPPIELVDGDVLVDMFERLELGLVPKRTTISMNDSLMTIGNRHSKRLTTYHWSSRVTGKGES